MYDTLKDRCDSDNRTVAPLYSRWASLGLKSQMQAAEHALAWLEGFSVVGRIPGWGVVCIFIYIFVHSGTGADSLLVFSIPCPSIVSLFRHRLS